MSWLDDLLGKTIQQYGVPVVDRKNLNFVSGATVTDNPGNDSTDVNISGGGGGGTVTVVSWPSTLIPAGDYATAVLTCAGAIVGNRAVSGWITALPPGVIDHAKIASSGQVTLTVLNLTGADLTIGTSNVNIQVTT